MNAKLANLWDTLRSSLWFVPTLMALAAVALSFMTIGVDQRVQFAWIQRVGIFWAGGPDGAYALLSTVAGSMITVAGTVFSIAIVVLTLASSQFGPRLLRNFMRDLGNQIVLGTFIGTFVYCLLVLRTVRVRENISFVPYISVTVGVLLAMASIGVLIYYIHHVSVSIQAPHIVATVGRSLNRNVERLFPRQVGQGEREQPDHTLHQLPPAFEQTARPVHVLATGYITHIDNAGLLQLTTRHDLVVRLCHVPGDFVVREAVLLLAGPPDRLNPALEQALAALFVVGTQRTPLQDVEFLFNELVEVAVRALSPAINDPFTAMASVDWLGAALCHLARSPQPSSYRYDAHHQLRVVAEPVTFPHAIDIAFNQIRQYGQTSMAVTVRLLETIAVIGAHVTRPEDGAALRRQASMIWRGRTALAEAEDQVTVDAAYGAVVAVLDRLVVELPV